MRGVGVRKLKRNGASASWTGHVLAEDDYGTWIAGTAGTRVAWCSPASSSEQDKETEAPLDILVLIPPSQWWVAAWWTNGDITVDVTLPARLEHGTWVFEDLELDLFLTPSGSHGLVDVDEFLDEVERGRILPEEREASLRTAGAVERMLKHREEPFGDVGWARFHEATSLQLPRLDPPSTPQPGA